MDYCDYVNNIRFKSSTRKKEQYHSLIMPMKLPPTKKTFYLLSLILECYIVGSIGLLISY